MKVSRIMLLTVALTSLSLPACERTHAEEGGGSHEGHQNIVVTTPEPRDVVITEPYVCQIRSRRYVEIKALDEGYLEEITVKEGQEVKQDEVMFRVRPVLYEARYKAEKAEVNFAEVELKNTKVLFQQRVVSDQQVALDAAKLAKAEAKMKLAEAELEFTKIKAPFDGIMDRLSQMQGSLVKKDEVLTTLSDNRLMWVYFNVPEARYLDYKARQGADQSISQLKLVDSKIELLLANGKKFNQTPGDTVTVEGKFNNETGNIAFRADFPNPDRLLRHGQTGTILIHRSMKNALVIPQRATYEILDKQYVWVVGEDHVVHQRPITIAHELEDIYVIKSGLDIKDKIILEGVQQVHHNEKVEYEFQKPEEALRHQKYHAE